MLRKIIDRVNSTDERIEIGLVDKNDSYSYHPINHIEEIDDCMYIFIKDIGGYAVKREEVVVDEKIGKCIKVELEGSLDEIKFYSRDHIDPYFNKENYDPADDFNYEYLIQVEKIVEVNFIEEIEKGE